MFEQDYYEKIGYEIFKKFSNYTDKYQSYITKSQISLLIGLITEYKFSNNLNITNVLEIGTYTGVTSLYMLKAGYNKSKNYKQYGIDIRNDTKTYGIAVKNEATNKEKEHFKLELNKTSLDIETIIDTNTKLDLVFIDGAHAHPFPLIDLLMVIPYLHNESLICLHDVIEYMRPHAWGESFIYEIWDDDKKYRNSNIFAINNPEIKHKYESLGIIKLPSNQKELNNKLIQISQIPFRATPWEFESNYCAINDLQIIKLEEFMNKHYEKTFTNTIINNLTKSLNTYKNEWILRTHETRFYNYLFNHITDLNKQIKLLNDKYNKLEKLYQQECNNKQNKRM